MYIVYVHSTYSGICTVACHIGTYYRKDEHKLGGVAHHTEDLEAAALQSAIRAERSAVVSRDQNLEANAMFSLVKCEERQQFVLLSLASLSRKFYHLPASLISLTLFDLQRRQGPCVRYSVECRTMRDDGPETTEY